MQFRIGRVQGAGLWLGQDVQRHHPRPGALRTKEPPARRLASSAATSHRSAGSRRTMEPLVMPPTHTAPSPAATLLGMPPAAVDPRSRVPVTWLDAGSTRHRRLSAPLLVPALVTQTAP